MKQCTYVNLNFQTIEDSTEKTKKYLKFNVKKFILLLYLYGSILYNFQKCHKLAVIVNLLLGYCLNTHNHRHLLI